MAFPKNELQVIKVYRQATMNFYDTMVDLYLQKKTVKGYASLQEFDADLQSLDLDLSYDLVYENPMLYVQLNEADFTFLICKMIDMKDYMGACILVNHNLRFRNQQIIDKFASILDNPESKKQGCGTLQTARGMLEEMVYRSNQKMYAPIDFLSVIYAVKNTEHPDFKLDEFMQQLGKLIDMKVVDYAVTEPAHLPDYARSMRKMSVYNQLFILKVLVDKNVVANPENLPLEEFLKSFMKEYDIYR